MGTEPRSGPVEQTDRVHVRTLGVVDTLRWSWEALTDRLELVGFVFLVALITVVANLGVSPATAGETPEFASWVWPLYLVYFLAVTVVWSVAYTSAADAVANRKRPLRDHVVAAAKRVPALVAVAIPTWILFVVGLLLFVLPGIYVLHRLVLAFPACVIDRKGPLASLKAGWRAGGGNVLKLVGVSLVYFALIGVSNYVAGIFGPLTVVGGLISAGLSAVLLPLFGLALGHLYLESSRNQ
ncbi:hypothetical protein M0R89_16350 [Halorussus limi]|uniref:Glycerophosphoryl diester phosphodiesterase membrane domain-containing protein n=1 Tax=Halorussus limi TaxID=2938695 RepID=A0A8U0HT91_9EURY|nr:hypothetical protein [Halorussus limi]UPV74097.1 hypothetical protein M0R89_16350 [Halorussus limi]